MNINECLNQKVIGNVRKGNPDAPIYSKDRPKAAGDAYYVEQRSFELLTWAIRGSSAARIGVR